MHSFIMLVQLVCTSTLLAQETFLRTDAPSDLRIGSLAVNRILFLGNSITVHAPAPEIGWTGNFGMAASSEDKDYVHQLVDQISRQIGGQPQIMVRNIAEFERNLSRFNIEEQLSRELKFGADIVILAIGENVAKPESTEAKEEFRQAFQKLLQTLEHHEHPHIFVRSQFWSDSVKDEIMKGETLNARQTWVDLSGKVDESCHARSERHFHHAGVAGHPGDKGMMVIADALMNSILKTARISPQHGGTD
ncbi:MAG: SGNH/GDSL hydrolase family protein [Planctomycetota bacterium]